MFVQTYSFMFDVTKWKGLKTPEEYIEGKWFSRDETMARMLQWDPDGPYSTLTRLEEKPIVKMAGKLFKNVKRFMRDEKAQYPDALADEVAEVLNDAQYVALRDEVYMYVIKQLTANPNPASRPATLRLRSSAVRRPVPPEKGARTYRRVRAVPPRAAAIGFGWAGERALRVGPYGAAAAQRVPIGRFLKLPRSVPAERRPR